jgi:pSer/pThr/pTyr-binding forkhead associated (FHA) protein
MPEAKTCPICAYVPKQDAEFCDECGWLMQQEYEGLQHSPETDLQEMLGFRPFVVLPERGTYGLNRVRTVIGREFGDILLREDLNVSRIHLAFLADGKNLYLEDLGSSNGTLLNDVRIQPQKRYPLSDGDIVQLGDTKLKMEFKGVQTDDESRAGTFLAGADFKYRLRRGENTIGRLPTNNIRVEDDPYLAREHASIFIEESPAGDDFIYIFDKHSSNGTFINGKKIAPGARIRIKPGDVVKLGEREYKLETGKR